MSNEAAPELPAIVDAAVPPDAPEPSRKRVWSWAMYDWSTQPFNSVIITFVFTALYLTTDAFIDPDTAALGAGHPDYDSAIAGLASTLGFGFMIAGIFVALLAPVLGQWADNRGRRKAWLGGTTLLLGGCMAGLFFVEPDPRFFMLGVALIAMGSVFGEIAGVNYNAMIVQVSTPRTMGKISGLGWGMGYMGGILALVVVVVATAFDWWGMDTSDGMAFRIIGVGAAVWLLIFAWPLFTFVPESPPQDQPRMNLWQSYGVLWKHLKELWHSARSTLWFLLASAVYRDGLAGIFTFGAIIAAVSFGFSPEQVMIFGIAANLIAGISTIIAGRLDDRFGPRAVILTALAVIIWAGVVIVLLRGEGTIVFWVCGLLLSACVGPAQAASRSLLARVSPVGREAEIFGLYATTGRAVSFLGPGMWALVIAITGATIWGTLGVISVVLLGLVFLLFVETPADKPQRLKAAKGSAL